MRILKWILGGIAALVVIFVVVGMILPRQVHVERSVAIDAPPAAVFPHVNSLKAAAAWSPWLGRDPAVQLAYSGPDAGPGARLDWASDNPQVGNGTQEITLTEPDRLVVTALDFGEMGVADATFLLEPTGAGTTVTWTLDSDMGAGPTGRWMGLMMDRWVGTDYEAGLTSLKALVEGT